MLGFGDLPGFCMALDTSVHQNFGNRNIVPQRFSQETSRRQNNRYFWTPRNSGGRCDRTDVLLRSGHDGCAIHLQILDCGRSVGGAGAVVITVLNGDCRSVLRKVEPASIQCCVTSPPYWGLRDYDHPAQIGSENSPIEYIKNLVEVFREVRRILKSDGVVWLNMGDSYARNGGIGLPGPNAKVGNTRKLIQHRNCRVPPCWGLKALDLMGIPWRVAFALQEDGWFLRSHVTWIKTAAMPESVKNRPTRATEEIFLLTASPKYFYDDGAVRQDSGANLRNYWLLGPDPNRKGHPSAFPRELARRCILLGSRPNDTVLDPFGGCGTTGVVAESLDRNSVLVELCPKWSKVIEDRANGSAA